MDMNKTIFKIQPTPQTMSQLARGVKLNGSKTWFVRVFQKRAVIVGEISQMLVAEFNNSSVARALRGQGSTDLPAHFGLNNSTANALADGMADLIKKSVRLGGSPGKDAMSIFIKAVEKDWNEYLSLSGASYVSSPSNITIPVAKWLLIDPTIDIGQAAYDIVFKGENNQFDVRIQHVSRSGRAIMVSLATLGGSGGYVLPSIVSGQAGQNFIEYTLGQPNIAMKATKILMNKIR